MAIAIAMPSSTPVVVSWGTGSKFVLALISFLEPCLLGEVGGS